MNSDKYKLIVVPVSIKHRLDKAKLCKAEPYQSVINRALIALKKLSEKSQ